MRPPGLTSGDGALERLGLLLDPHLQRAGPHPPFGVRIAPPGADAGAGRVDQHEVELAFEIGELVADGLRRPHLDVARAGALEPVVDRRKPALVVVGGVDLALVFHQRRERQRLAAAAGAKVEHLLAGLGAGEQRGELRALVLDFDQALEIGELGMDRRALGIGAKLDAQAVRRPARRLGREIGERSRRLVAAWP